MSRKAFTLLELLVVIAVIGILAALMLPVLGRVKQRAADAACLSNLRQIGIAMTLYQNDFGGKYPMKVSLRSSPGAPPGNDIAWDSLIAASWDFTQCLGGSDGLAGQPGTIVPPASQRPLFPYVSEPQVFHCRQDRGWDDKVFYHRNVLPSYKAVFGCSYTYNAIEHRDRVGSPASFASSGPANKSETFTPDPSRFVLMFEEPGSLQRRWSPVILWHQSAARESLMLNEHAAKGRRLVSPYLFVDGHSSMLAFKSVEDVISSPRLVWQNGL